MPTPTERFIAEQQRSIVDHEKRIRQLEKLAKEGEKKLKELIAAWNKQQRAATPRRRI
jgi:hypothetical protein